MPLPAGHDLHGKLAGATIDVVPGMGHDLPAQLLDRYADGITAVARRAAR